MQSPEQIYIIDTSSLIGVRENFGKANERKVFTVLTALVNKEQLFYPPEVCTEVERGSDEDQPDAACRWVRRTKTQAERKPEFESVRDVLIFAPDLVDPDHPYDEADPYVVALGVGMRSEELVLDFVGRTEITIVTEDRVDKPRKLSLATAAGMVGLPTIPLFALVRIGGISP